MQTILEFISIFQSSSNINLFTDCACYYFAVLLKTRFPSAILMYHPHNVHFAVKIQDSIYDITGLVIDTEDYVEWRKYKQEYEEDADIVLHNCMKIERR